MSVQSLAGTSRGRALVRQVYERTSADYTTSGTTMQNIDGTNLLFTLDLPEPARVRMTQVCHVLGGATANQQIFMDIAVDGTRVGTTDSEGIVAFRNANDTTQRRYNGSFSYTTDILAAGSHTFAFMWASASGTATIVVSGKPRWIVEEIPNTTGGLRGPAGPANGVHQDSVPPTINDDENDGYTIGTMWVIAGATNPKVWTCMDDTAGAAVWRRISEWDVDIVKAADQSVTNSATMANDTELQFPVGSDESWAVECILLLSTDATGDYKTDFSYPGINLGVREYFGSDSTSNAVQGPSAIRESSGSDSTDITGGGGSTSIRRMLWSRAAFHFSSSGTFVVRFAQNTQTSGQSAIMKAGSWLKARRLA